MACWEDVPEELKCCVCLDLLHEPVVLCTSNDWDAHALCASCAARVLSRPAARCPLCRMRCSGGATPALHARARLVAALVDCALCGARVGASNARAHAAACPNRPATPEDDDDEVSVADADSRGLESNGVHAQGPAAYRCTLCSDGGLLDRASMVAHLEEVHAGASGVCPICVAHPWGDARIRTRDVAAHARHRHAFEYGEFVAFELLSDGDDNQVARALEESLAGMLPSP